MKQFTTEINAIDPVDGELKRWQGPNIEADSFEDAERICLEKFGYLKVTGQFIQEIGWNSALFASKLDQENNN